MDLQYKKQASCPSDQTLFSYKTKTLTGDEYDEVVFHLLFCDACLVSLQQIPSDDDGQKVNSDLTDDEREDQIQITQEMLEAFEDFRARETVRLAQPPRTLEQVTNEEGIQIGQVWRTRFRDVIVPIQETEESVTVTALNSRQHLVLVTDVLATAFYGKYHVIRVVPISPEIECAGEDDVVVDEANSPFGYSFIIEAWNEQSMLRENLETCLGAFDTFKQRIILSKLRHTLEEIRRTGKRAQSIEETVKSGQYQQPIMRFRAHEYEETLYMRLPVQALSNPQWMSVEEAMNDEGVVRASSHLEQLATILADRIVGVPPDIKEPVLPSIQKNLTDTSDELIYLAARSTADERKTEDSEKRPRVFPSIVIDELSFDLLRDENAYIYLEGPVPPTATHLRLGAVCYELGKEESKGVFRVEGLNVIRLDRFLTDRNLDPVSHVLEFARIQKVKN